MGLFEWSAPEDCDIWDREAWAQAAPSMGHPDENGIVLVTEEMYASKAALVGVGGDEGIPEHVFRTENLCNWVSVEIDGPFPEDRKSTRLNSSHVAISYAVFCLKKKRYRTRRRDVYREIDE